MAAYFHRHEPGPPKVHQLRFPGYAHLRRDSSVQGKIPVGTFLYIQLEQRWSWYCLLCLLPLSY